jgi:hypothetical protein
MLARLLLFCVFAPIAALAVIVIGGCLAARLALDGVIGAVAGCTQWRPQ